MNQMFRSGPTAMLIGEPGRLGMANSVTFPSGVICPIRLPSTCRSSILPFSSRNPYSRQGPP